MGNLITVNGLKNNSSYIMIIVFWLLIKTGDTYCQDYSECIIEKSKIIPEELVRSKLNKSKSDLLPGDEIILDEYLIKNGDLIRSPFQEIDPGKLDYLIGETLRFQRTSRSEISFLDKNGRNHIIYLQGYNQGRAIGKDLNVERMKQDFVLKEHVGTIVALKEAENQSIFSSSVIPYEIRKIKYNTDRDKLYLLLKEIYPDGTKQQGFVGYDFSDDRFGLYRYECFTNEFIGTQKRYIEFLESKFSAREVESIKQGVLFIGMSEHAIPHVIGHPNRTNTTVVEGGTTKQLVYGDGIYVYLLNGKVKAYQNLESLKGF